MKNDICSNCGASQGLHHYKTMQCPKNGIEEMREGHKQVWIDTIFEDSGIKEFTQKAINMHENFKSFCRQIKEALQDRGMKNLSVFEISILNEANNLLKQSEQK